MYWLLVYLERLIWIKIDMLVNNFSVYVLIKFLLLVF